MAMLLLLLLAPSALAVESVSDPSVSDPSVSEPASEPASELAPPAEFTSPEPLIPAEDDADVPEMANYSDGNISIDYPATWEVDLNETGEIAIDSATESLESKVETEVFQVAAPPGPLVDANIDSFIEEGSAVSRYSEVTIDDQSALVVWLADRPEELSSAIATFIGYGDNTVFLFSRYNPDNATAEDNILRLHSSFTNLTLSEADADADGVTESVSPDSSSPDETAPVSEPVDLPVDLDESFRERSPDSPGNRR
ncbi:MAG: hypothetical protein ACFB16_04420 [Phormidesmis sp.]